MLPLILTMAAFDWLLVCPAGQSAPQTPVSIHVLKIAAGPSGYEEKGTFLLKEERSIFNRSDDREVIVLFQWEGAPGAHKLAAQWRSPDGSQNSVSTIDYMAKDRRFGAYWSLPLSPGIQLGHWSIEATVDGQPAGRYSFEITDTKVKPALVKRPLAQSELYERLTKMFVVLQRSSATGQELDTAAGFVGGADRIVTAMAAVDDTDRIRAVMADGSSRELDAVIAWNRRQDWAVIAVATGAEQPAAAPPDSTNVGDRCFTMEGGVTGGRVLLEGAISGKGGAGPGPRLLATFFTGTGMPGAPVINEFGDLIGVVGGAHVPGATRLMHIMRFRAMLRGVPIVPFSLIRSPDGSSPRSLVDLRAKGELIPALSGEEHVLSGGFSRGVSRQQTITPSEQREEFSASEKGFVVFVTMNARVRLRGMMRLRIYDADNRIVAEGKPTKSDFRKEQLIFSSWQVPMLQAPGTYRADVLFEDKPIWRGFVRITP